MREKSEITHHCRQVPSGFGRRPRLPPRADAGDFPLAHVVALQYTIFFSIFSGDGI